MPPAGFEPGNPSTRAATDLRLRLLGLRDRQGFDLLTVQSVATRYTDCCIPALLIKNRMDPDSRPIGIAVIAALRVTHSGVNEE